MIGIDIYLFDRHKMEEEASYIDSGGCSYRMALNRWK